MAKILGYNLSDVHIPRYLNHTSTQKLKNPVLSQSCPPWAAGQCHAARNNRGLLSTQEGVRVSGHHQGPQETAKPTRDGIGPESDLVSDHIASLVSSQEKNFLYHYLY